MATAGEQAASAATDDRDWEPNFHWLTEQLALGGCFPIDRAPDLAQAHGIGAIVDLRQEACDDEDRLRAVGIDLLHLPTPDLEPASYEQLERGVEFVRDR